MSPPAAGQLDLNLASRLPGGLPAAFGDWFAQRGWAPHDHQLAMLEAARANEHALLVAPTGGGKTLAGFLPSLVQLSEAPTEELHTLYVSPLKALAVDIHRNLTLPVEQMGLAIAIETRTGDTPAAKKQRQRRKPPNLLLTTPESLSLLIASPDAPRLFRDLACVVVDELHALAGTKRGDLLALALSRLQALAPNMRRVGLSATVAWPDELAAFLSPRADAADVKLVLRNEAREAEVEILETDAVMPWSGRMALHAMENVYARLRETKTAIVFVNTRAQAELVFQALWKLNEDGLKIGLHHGSLAAEQRRKVEAAMARGDLNAVVATSSLDLGIDWGDVDLVVQVGAPKGVSRLMQRIGRAGHRLDVASRALLVPANRMEFLECVAARDGVDARSFDDDKPRNGALDVLAQHILAVACAGWFSADALWEEVKGAAPYSMLTRAEFDAALDFVATGGYALRRYQRWHKLARDGEGRYRAATKDVERRYRMNAGTIVEADTIKVKYQRGRTLGAVEEYFIAGLEPGDTFMFAGQLLTFVGMRGNAAEVVPGGSDQPKVPAYGGGRLPLTTHVAQRMRELLSRQSAWNAFPPQVVEWLRLQQYRSTLPDANSLLIETFPRNDLEYMVAYSFAGRNAHQTLGMLLTKRMERLGIAPLGFVATDYAISIWSARPAHSFDALFDEDMLGDDLEEWMQTSSIMRRTFRHVAVVAGLIERKQPGAEKSGRQVTFNADLIYDTLRKHEPEHFLLRATYANAAHDLAEVKRLGDMLRAIKGRIRHERLDKVSPLAVPVLLEIGRESVEGQAAEMLLEEEAEALIAEVSGA